MQDIDELYDKKVKCSVCNYEFITKKVRISRLKLIKRDEDFLSYYKGENPIKYNIFVCPNCGFSATESKYNSITSSKKKIISNEITSKWNKRSYGGKRTIETAIETFKLAIYIGQLLDYKKIELGSLSLNLAWLYRINGNKDEEMRFLRLTKNLYEEGFHNESLVDTNMDEIKLMYLIGEINRRLGYKDKALKWFSTVKSNKNINSNSILKSMLMDQWRLIREG